MFIKKLIPLILCFGSIPTSAQGPVTLTKEEYTPKESIEFEGYKFDLFSSKYSLRNTRLTSIHPIVFVPSQSEHIQISIEDANELLMYFLNTFNTSSSTAVRNYLAFLSNNIEMLKKEIVNKALLNDSRSLHLALVAYILFNDEYYNGLNIAQIDKVEALEREIKSFFKDKSFLGILRLNSEKAKKHTSNLERIIGDKITQGTLTNEGFYFREQPAFEADLTIPTPTITSTKKVDLRNL